MSPGISTRLLVTQSDERLVALVRQGHDRAFEALVHRYRKPLLHYCRRLLPEARVEDVLQQALLKTWIALRGGTEVRDLRPWLYRIVHNTAINAVRDASRDRDRLLESASQHTASQAAGGSDFDLDRGLAMREALAEVAALPPLQREVIVRTAVGGDSHEQVASDLGLTDGAVRGLLYRARTTLRAAVTALTPPPLLSWLAGSGGQGGQAPEQLAGLAAGGGTAGLSGLLIKGGVVALTAGTLITGAAVVHIQQPPRHHHPREVASNRSPGDSTTASASTTAGSGAAQGAITGGGVGYRRLASGHPSGSAAGPHPGLGGSHTGPVSGPDGSGRLQTPVAGPRGHTRTYTPGAGAKHPEQGGGVPGTPTPAPSAPTESGPVGGSTTGQAGSGSAGAGSGGGGSSGSSSSGGGSNGGGAGGADEGSSAPTGGEQPAGSTQGTSEQPSSGGQQGGSSGSESSGGSGGGNSGGIVGTVVHEVGSLVEHLLH